MKRLLFLGSLCLWPGCIAMATESAAGQPLNPGCAQLLSPLVRLACYDRQISYQASRLPEHSPTLTLRGLKIAVQPSGPRNSAFVLETQPDTLVLQQRIPGASLRIRCQQRITHLSVTLDQPLPMTAQAPAVLLDDQPYPVRWFLRQQRQVLESARGLAAIAQLKRWLDADRVRFVLDQAPGLQFDLRGLSRDIAPLRQECHW